MKKYLLLLLVFPIFAHATLTASLQKYFVTSGGDTGWSSTAYHVYKTELASCTAFVGSGQGFTVSAIAAVEGVGGCTFKLNGTSHWASISSYTYSGDLACPANSEVYQGSCVCLTSYSEDPTHTFCVAISACAGTLGATIVRNITAGYARTAAGANGAGSLYPELKPDGSVPLAGYTHDPQASAMCFDGCEYNQGTPVRSWSSTQPTATGLYRISDDWNYIGKGNSCTQAQITAAVNLPLGDASYPPPACPGFVGYVNGSLTCVGTSTTAPFKPDARPGGTLLGNPAASSSGDGTLSSRSPSVASGGNGGNAGGPPGPTDGSLLTPNGVIVGTTAGAPTGTASAPAAGLEQLACGAPGQPACKLDEVGTPSGSADSVLQNSKDALTAAANSITGMISSPAVPSGSGWTFTSGAFGLPSGSCQPFVFVSRLGTMSVDVCTNTLVNTMRGMLAWLMYCTTLLYVWRTANGGLEKGGM